jgi:SAM-dependent methyltransferase
MNRTESDGERSAQGILFEDFYRSFTDAVDADTSEMTLLDFGCGKKGYVKFYDRYFGRCYALDIVDYFAKYYDDDEGIEFLFSDGRGIPLPDRSLDVIVSHSVLEHVEDIDIALGEMNRTLKTGGYAYLTVSPLYYSESGGHNTMVDGQAQRVRDWRHLDPDSAIYMGQDSAPYRLPPEQWSALLNKLTVSRFLAAVGRQPWNILDFSITAPDLDLPPFLRASSLSRVDLFVREFRFIGRKAFSVIDDQITTE